MKNMKNIELILKNMNPVDLKELEYDELIEYLNFKKKLDPRNDECIKKLACD